MKRSGGYGVAMLLAWAAFGPARAADDGDAAWRVLQGDAVVLLRHATAPGIGDPADFKLGDCTTQRNLDAVGKAEAARIGESFRAHGIKVGAVWSSRWCRTRETAELAFPGQVKDEPLFDSFFDDAARAAKQTAAARALLRRWKGPGVLVVVTHQVNITALTKVVPLSGEAIVIEPGGKDLAIVGRINAAR